MPMSALCGVGASLVPSPITATICPIDCMVSTNKSLAKPTLGRFRFCSCSVQLLRAAPSTDIFCSWPCAAAPMFSKILHSKAMAFAVARLSRVTILTVTLAAFTALTAASTSGPSYQPQPRMSEPSLEDSRRNAQCCHHALLLYSPLALWCKPMLYNADCKKPWIQ
ncbi:hypothetical protein GOP47_0003433 [Adiantum capillus-veneris]|uniref:Uncharacterized protein n=1 Tax=Adiantum capillus-veneris TaxID=13818 RepID=A0A9D4VCT9_ADICA|nr:hypothetical protein GOP47_0003433 [Adiantum capillus-veneris]